MEGFVKGNVFLMALDLSRFVQGRGFGAVAEKLLSN